MKEINKKLATEIMGWEIVGNQYKYDIGNSTIYKHIDNVNFCENISDAWMLVEKLGRRDSIEAIQINFIPETNKGFKWKVKLISDKFMNGYPSEFAETAPMAISLAFLEVMNGRE